MGEITAMAMPAELMAAMNIFGGSGGDITPVSAEDGSQSSSFDAVLGLLMANSAQTQVQIQPVPEKSEAEAQSELTAADILSEALKGNAEAKLPEVFTEKGAEAFIETLSRILPEYDGDELPEETLSLWKNVSPEEKKAFAELLYAAADLSEDENILTEESPEDIVRIICRIMVNSLKKTEKKDSEKAQLSDEALLVQGMNLLRPLQTVSYDDMGTEIQERAEAVDTAYTEHKAAPEIPVQSEITDEPKAQNTGDVPVSDIKTAYEKLSEAESEEIVSFCRKLADELNASVKETAPEAVEEPAPETDHIGYGRQGMQGFMARVNRHEKLPAGTGAEIIPAQAEHKGAVTDIPLGEDIPREEDIGSQIMRQIDLYRDIFRESFSEREISMKLNPESLGGVEIKIRRSDKGFEITFTADKAEAAELIGNKSSELAEALASRGIALKELSVTSRIVTNRSDGSLTDGNLFGSDDLYGSAQNGQSGSERHFSFGGQAPSDAASEAADESASDINFNREAKLWVSA